MATLGGRRALGMQDQLGSLEPGKLADLIALDLDEIGWAPNGFQDPYTALVYSVTGQHVRDVMVNGAWLMRANQLLTVDYAASCAQLEHDVERLKAAVADKPA